MLFKSECLLFRDWSLHRQAWNMDNETDIESTLQSTLPGCLNFQHLAVCSDILIKGNDRWGV